MMLSAPLADPISARADQREGGELWSGHADLVHGAVVTDRTDMNGEWVPSHTPFDPQSERILDTARGILIGLRRCGSDAALQELLVAARRHRVPVFAVAWALVHLTCGGDKSPETLNTAQSAARQEWGRLLAEPVGLTC